MYWLKVIMIIVLLSFTILWDDGLSEAVLWSDCSLVAAGAGVLLKTFSLADLVTHAGYWLRTHRWPSAGAAAGGFLMWPELSHSMWLDFRRKCCKGSR